MEIDLGEAFRKKFPKVCPYCLAQVCQCAETHRAPVNNLPVHAVRGELTAKYDAQKRSFPELALVYCFRKNQPPTNGKFKSYQ
ncbi:hypothetical protein GCM10009085_48270 [Pseudomonas avellanae]|nr:hypothetical protein GCM10009085_48270 [Pseudomonas avellanae]